MKKTFDTANPGYQLKVTPVRSLERQVRLWCKSTSVGQAGTGLLKTIRKDLSDDDFPEPPEIDEYVRPFAEKLRDSKVSPEPTNAAPGTSDHGRGLAVDFVVMKGAVTVAPIDKSKIDSIWKKEGWEDKLISACAGTRLRGPLKHPYESWHWVLA